MSAAALDDELPPAYTPGPDLRRGESTIQYGPARPFQDAPRMRPPPEQHPQPQHHSYPHQTYTPRSSFSQRTAGRGQALLQQLTGQLVSHLAAAVAPGATPAAARYAYPGQTDRRPTPPSLPPTRIQSPRPPLKHHPTSRNSRATFTPRRKYQRARSLTCRMRGRLPLGRPRLIPPPPTPRPASAGDLYWEERPDAERTWGDETRPTSTPVPGRALLRNGRMLVYPAGVECSKCNNTGYRHGDPSHPCTRCWDKYGKMYGGALALAPTNAASARSPMPNHGSTFQRPLPNLRAAGSSSAFRAPQRSPSLTHRASFPPSPSSSGYPPPPPTAAPPIFIFFRIPSTTVEHIAVRVRSRRRAPRRRHVPTLRRARAHIDRSVGRRGGERGVYGVSGRRARLVAESTGVARCTMHDVVVDDCDYFELGTKMVEPAR
ncbi:hypothetical protein MKEN_00286100 [Mycena kentingensis (nom. inval.)]|nr:hypothetical protein MKEN_00286100 [Mycena kentingensis (nom. inval.)]